KDPRHRRAGPTQPPCNRPRDTQLCRQTPQQRINDARVAQGHIGKNRRSTILRNPYSHDTAPPKPCSQDGRALGQTQGPPRHSRDAAHAQKLERAYAYRHIDCCPRHIPCPNLPVLAPTSLQPGNPAGKELIQGVQNTLGLQPRHLPVWRHDELCEQAIAFSIDELYGVPTSLLRIQRALALAARAFTIVPPRAQRTQHCARGFAHASHEFQSEHLMFHKIMNGEDDIFPIAFQYILKIRAHAERKKNRGRYARITLESDLRFSKQYGVIAVS